MTKVTFLKKNGLYFGFEEDGHTGLAEAGGDVLCAALSAMSMLIVNTIEISFAADVEVSLDEAGARLLVKCPQILPPSELDERKRYAIAGLFQGYFFQLNDLLEEYFDYLDVAEREVP